VDLGITILHIPGHTPDELAWYDHDEMHLYVGDSFYEAGQDDMPIIWPADGNMIEWVFSMRKLISLVESENLRASATEDEADEDGWTQVSRRVKTGSGHQTYAADGMEVLERLWDVWWRTVRAEVPVVKKQVLWGDAWFTWREKDMKSGMYFKAPARLMDDTRRFFEGDGPSRGKTLAFG
jgi:glyoxylase-like metal-dependent hydrolase (beta-lactamase superfamily II)